MTACAVSGSRCAVGSSSTSTGASESRARATVSRWRWPPESRFPSSPTSVSSPSGKEEDPALQTGAAKCLHELGIGGARSAEEQVGADRRVEDMRVLAGEGEGATHVFLPVLAQVVAAERDPSCRRVEEAEQEVRHGRLARAARPEERERRPGSSRRSNPAALVARRARTSAVTPSSATDGTSGGGRGALGSRNGGAAVDHVEDSPPGGQGPTEIVRGSRKRRNRFERRDGEQREHRDQHPVEGPGGVCVDRDREDPHERQTRNEGRQAVSRGRRRAHRGGRGGRARGRATRRARAHDPARRRRRARAPRAGAPRSRR